MHKFFLLLKRLVPTFLIYTLFYGCSPSTTGSESETEMEIALVGKVESDKKLPIKNVVVSLSKFNLVDTTDSLGNYNISEFIDISGFEDDTIKDTLLFMKDSSVLKKYIISDFTDTINVTVYQRDFVGSIAGNLPEGGSISLNLTTIEEGDTVESVFPLGYIASTKKYSGIGFFKYNSNAVYSAWVKVCDRDGNFIGRSISIPFTSVHGVIEFPEFNIYNMTPYMKGVLNPSVYGDTIVIAIEPGGVNDKLLSDSLFYNSVKEICFKFGEDSSFTTTFFGSILILDKSKFSDFINLRVTAIFNFGDSSHTEIDLKLVDTLSWDYNDDMAETYGDYWGHYTYLDSPTTVVVCEDNAYDGKKAVKLTTTSTSNVGLTIPNEYGAIDIISLKESDSLTFWAYTDNIGKGFQFKSPIIVFKSDEPGYDYIEYHYELETTPFNDSFKKWHYISIPLSGSTTWRRDIVGAASLDNVNQIRIHAVGNDPGYTIWIDKLIIKEAK